MYADVMNSKHQNSDLFTLETRKELANAEMFFFLNTDFTLIIDRMDQNRSIWC